MRPIEHHACLIASDTSLLPCHLPVMLRVKAALKAASPVKPPAPPSSYSRKRRSKSFRGDFGERSYPSPVGENYDDFADYNSSSSSTQGEYASGSARYVGGGAGGRFFGRNEGAAEIGRGSDAVSGTSGDQGNSGGPGSGGGGFNGDNNGRDPREGGIGVSTEPDGNFLQVLATAFGKVSASSTAPASVHGASMQRAQQADSDAFTGGDRGGGGGHGAAGSASSEGGGSPHARVVAGVKPDAWQAMERTAAGGEAGAAAEVRGGCAGGGTG